MEKTWVELCCRAEVSLFYSSEALASDIIMGEGEEDGECESECKSECETRSIQND
jgi:hypothetical protein